MYKVSLAAARINAGYKQEEVAKELKISKSTLISWEKGKVTPRVEQFKALCILYKVPEDNINLPKTLQKVDKI